MESIASPQRISHLSAKVSKRREECVKNLESAERTVGEVSRERRQYITSLSFDALRKALPSREVTALETLRFYQWKALEAHRKINCIALFIEEADEWA